MKDTSVKILAIETSCDETAGAILIGKLKTKKPDFKILSSVVNSQIEIHKKTGGVIPEVAARAHVKNIVPVVSQTLKKAKLKLSDINLIAVTAGPGLVVSLVIGVEFAKTLALSTGKKMIPTNHMEGHLYSGNTASFPALSLIVSGGHTMLVLMKDLFHYKVIGSTVDDAAGEAFDKVAKLLGLPYPGGPAISKIASGVKTEIEFPRPMLNQNNFNFSFSGLKTSVRNFIKDNPKVKKNEIASAFQEAVVDVLVKKTLKAVAKYKVKSVSLSGGVAANKMLREELTKACKSAKVSFSVPPFEMCTDNAQMIAIASYIKLLSGYKPVAFNKVCADPSWEIK